MSTRWLTFARTGEPNAPGLITWKPYTVSHRDTLVIDRPIPSSAIRTGLSG